MKTKMKSKAKAKKCGKGLHFMAKDNVAPDGGCRACRNAYQKQWQAKQRQSDKPRVVRVAKPKIDVDDALDALRELANHPNKFENVQVIRLIGLGMRAQDTYREQNTATFYGSGNATRRLLKRMGVPDSALKNIRD